MERESQAMATAKNSFDEFMSLLGDADPFLDEKKRLLHDAHVVEATSSSHAVGSQKRVPQPTTPQWPPHWPSTPAELPQPTTPQWPPQPTTPPWRRPSSPVPPPSSSTALPQTSSSAMAANKRKRVVSTEELIELQAERWAAETVGVKWQDRGPPGPDRGGASEWRGQQWRAGTNGGKQRFANRGGAKKEYYTELYKAKAAGPEALEAFFSLHGHPKQGHHVYGGSSGSGGQQADSFQHGQWT